MLAGCTRDFYMGLIQNIRTLPGSREKSMEQRVKEHLCQVYGLGLDDVEELYGLGCQTVAATLGRLESAFLRSDAQEVADAGHMLKGALFNMGLLELGELARALELAGKAGRMEEARAVYGALCPALKFF